MWGLGYEAKPVYGGRGSLFSNQGHECNDVLRLDCEGGWSGESGLIWGSGELVGKVIRLRGWSRWGIQHIMVFEE